MVRLVVVGFSVIGLLLIVGVKLDVGHLRLLMSFIQWRQELDL
jgi:hypothetical protein